jgi:sarcosine oxidase gamma subunit
MLKFKGNRDITLRRHVVTVEGERVTVKYGASTSAMLREDIASVDVAHGRTVLRAKGKSYRMAMSASVGRKLQAAVI